MTTQLVLVDSPEALPQPEPGVKRSGSRGIPSAQCGCGRFAKHLHTRHRYNGQWSIEVMTVDCSRCGEQSIYLT